MTKQQFMLFRLFTSLIFIYAGAKHLINATGIFKRISAGKFYLLMPYESFIKASILISGVLMILGGVALIINYKIKIAATLLLAIIIGITLTVQLENLNDLGPFFKNIAIIGSLLLIINIKNHDNKKIHHSHISSANKHSIILTEKSTS